MEAARSRREVGTWKHIPPEQRWAEMRRRIETSLAEVFRPDRERAVFSPERLLDMRPRNHGGD